MAVTSSSSPASVGPLAVTEGLPSAFPQFRMTGARSVRIAGHTWIEGTETGAIGGKVVTTRHATWIPFAQHGVLTKLFGRVRVVIDEHPRATALAFAAGFR